MEQDLFLNLPQEIVIEILSRLPIISIVKCKSVCKWWLYLIKSDEFVKSHLSKSKSVPGLALSQSVTRYKPHQIIEFIDTQNSEAHILFSFGFSFRFPQEVEICGSANGLLLLVNFERIDDNVSVCNPFICNPITREYIRLPSPTTKMCGITFGFGVSKVSSEYKVIAAFRECHLDPLTGYPLWDLVEDKFKVYTLGTGSSWRSISASHPKWWNDCVFLNGKFHWLVYEEKSIKCFDIETECFSTFSTPEFVFYGCRRRMLCELGDHGLCLYDDKYNGGGGGDDDVIWMMKEYGDDKSWTKLFLIKRPLELWVFIKPIKILKDGAILFAKECSNRLYRYSIKTQTFREIYRRASSDYKPIYTPTFFSLKTFSKENMTLVRPFVSPRTARKLRRQRKHSLKSKKGQDLIQYVPSQVMIEILSRLPILSIMRCKCVCKSWLDLIKSDEFLKSHLSNSAPGLAVYVYGEEYACAFRKEFVELVDGGDLNCHWKIDLNRLMVRELRLHSCANGLLFLHKTRNPFQRDSSINRSINIICNPVTREYMMLPPPLRSPSTMFTWELELYGFGVSRMSGIYKVVRIFISQTSHAFVDCQVYTVGLGCRWRSIASPFHWCTDSALGAFLKGNLHWLGYDPKDFLQRIYCIDLETEIFTTLSPPPTPLSFEGNQLSVLGDCLCACCDSFIDHKNIEIWLMKEYGDVKSWTKQFVIYKASFDEPIAPSPIKVFGNRDILMEDRRDGLLYYSSKTATIREARDVFGLGRNNYKSARIYTPSFLSLKTFAENVFSF